MSSSVDNSAVAESQNNTQLRTEGREETTKSAFEHLREYGRQRPERLALWCLCAGFVLGWRLKPW